MQRYQDSVLIQNTNGVTVVGTGLTVTVYNAGTAVLATIYSNNGVTLIPQLTTPIITDINGRFEFYAVNGRYDVTITGAAITPITVPDIFLEDLSQFFGGNYADNTGTVNALVVSYPTAITATLFDGYPIEVDTLLIGTNTNTVVLTPTILGVALPTRAVYKYTGGGQLTQLVAGDIPPIAQLRYLTSASAWILINPTLGEYLTSTVPVGIALTSATATVIATLTLSNGIWDVAGTVDFLLGANTSLTQLVEGTNTIAALGATNTRALDYFAPTVFGAVTITKACPPNRIIATAVTTVYLLAQATFTVSTVTAGGTIQARRVAQ